MAKLDSTPYHLPGLGNYARQLPGRNADIAPLMALPAAKRWAAENIDFLARPHPWFSSCTWRRRLHQSFWIRRRREWSFPYGEWTRKPVVRYKKRPWAWWPNRSAST